MSRIKTKIREKMTDQERLAFAKQIETLYEAAHVDTKKVFGFAVIKGIGTGLGIFLGGTIVVAFLLWLLSFSNHLPFVGPISQAAENSIHDSKKSNAE